MILLFIGYMVLFGITSGIPNYTQFRIIEYWNFE